MRYIQHCMFFDLKLSEMVKRFITKTDPPTPTPKQTHLPASLSLPLPQGISWQLHPERAQSLPASSSPLAFCPDRTHATPTDFPRVWDAPFSMLPAPSSTCPRLWKPFSFQWGVAKGCKQVFWRDYSRNCSCSPVSAYERIWKNYNKEDRSYFNFIKLKWLHFGRGGFGTSVLYVCP